MVWPWQESFSYVPPPARTFLAARLFWAPPIITKTLQLCTFLDTWLFQAEHYGGKNDWGIFRCWDCSKFSPRVKFKTKMLTKQQSTPGYPTPRIALFVGNKISPIIDICTIHTWTLLDQGPGSYTHVSESRSEEHRYRVFFPPKSTKSYSRQG